MAGALVLSACGNASGTEASTEKNTEVSSEKNTEVSTEKNTEGSSEKDTEASTEKNTEGQAIDNGYKQAYIDQIKKCESEKEGDTNITYDLIYINDDDIPELVAGVDGFYIDLYTYADGKAYVLTDYWPYGAGGNAGYQYIPYKNVIENENADQAGAIRYYYYWMIDDSHALKAYNDADLSLWLFDDKNGNGIMDEEEYTGDDGECYYYYADQKISKEEFESHQITGDYQWITGTKTADEMIAQLQQ